MFRSVLDSISLDSLYHNHDLAKPTAKCNGYDIIHDIEHLVFSSNIKLKNNDLSLILNRNLGLKFTSFSDDNPSTDPEMIVAGDQHLPCCKGTDAKDFPVTDGRVMADWEMDDEMNMFYLFLFPISFLGVLTGFGCGKYVQKRRAASQSGGGY